ncbi:MAG TPA: hypothetical protein VHX63_12475 [Acidobacteriaceae bacterium]|jgi:hypothetical protein|nr:hypothetical protein [Acidobacteriaceae bacterium]
MTASRQIEEIFMFEQATIPVENPAVFSEVKTAIEAVFAPTSVAGYLKHVERAQLRAREFEKILHEGLLGATTKTRYAELGNSDQGQIRERYLQLVERVAPELRGKYRKVYVSY